MLNLLSQQGAKGKRQRKNKLKNVEQRPASTIIEQTKKGSLQFGVHRLATTKAQLTHGAWPKPFSKSSSFRFEPFRKWFKADKIKETCVIPI